MMPPRSPRPTYPLLERLTTLMLLLVVILLGWILAAAYLPEVVRVAPPEVEVILVLGVLLAALLLVSVVALLHTRSDG
jgi:hypothetical protein